MRSNLRIISMIGHKLAHLWGGCIGRLGQQSLMCNADTTAADMTHLSVDDCPKRYPSPGRYVRVLRVPVTPFGGEADFSWNQIAPIELGVKGAQDARTRNSNRENIKCSKHHSFLPRQLFWVCQPARKTPTPKTRLSVLAHVLPHPRFPTSLIVKQHLPLLAVPHLARLLTKLVCPSNITPRGATTSHYQSRAGITPARLSCV